MAAIGLGRFNQLVRPMIGSYKISASRTSLVPSSLLFSKALDLCIYLLIYLVVVVGNKDFENLMAILA